MAAEVQTTSTPPQKFSRYRSVRIAALKDAPAPSLPALPSHTAGAGARPEPSRYKHKRPSSGLPGLSQIASVSPGKAGWVDALSTKLERLQPLEGNTTPNAHRTGITDTENGNDLAISTKVLPTDRKEGYGPRGLLRHAADLNLADASDSQNQGLHATEGLEDSVAKRKSDDAHREAYAILNGEVNRERRLHQMPRESGQRTNQSIRNEKTEKVNPQWLTTEEKLGQAKDIHRGLSTAHRKADSAAQKLDQAQFPNPERRSLQRNLPGIDAPVSAVNTGERNVRVKFNKSSIVVPVTPATTVDDVLQFAAENFPEGLDTNSAVLLESFKPLGLERPLRRYEHVRDVLNSWDLDSQNSLLVVQSFTGLGENSLGIASTPARQPDAASVSIYHSQKPGVWEKRQITLREDGQVVLAKHNGETTNICHMSDFDLYNPTHRQAKKLSPPKKLCFGIKSQQKSAMFLTTANFVHFFSTKDKVVAETWYKAVQDWRSWYLVHVMGNGQRQLISKPALAHSVDRPVKHEKRNSKQSPSRPMRMSIPAETMDDIVIDSPTKPVAESSALISVDAALRKRPFRNHAAPPASFSKHFATISDTEPLAILAQSVSFHSPKAQGETTLFPGQFGKPPGLRFGAPHTQSSGTAPQTQSKELARSTSQRHEPAPLKSAPLYKPLVDLSLRSQEPAQHSRRGRGITISQMPIGGLVNIATSPEGSAPVPSTTILQRPGTGYQTKSGMQRTLITRAPAPHGTSLLPNPEKQEVAFLMGGLLAQADIRREGRKAATGAKTGDRDGREPMLDVAESSIYVPGSLLAGVEKQAGSTGPTIDREKKTEVVTSTGECT
ncbi:hypothetical protein MMC26_005242 [Xylographa opegraphella]|nr:hypothetical protein [Xylographa opegraphella]